MSRHWRERERERVREREREREMNGVAMIMCSIELYSYSCYMQCSLLSTKQCALQGVDISMVEDLDRLLSFNCLKQVILEDCFCVKLNCRRNESPDHLLTSPSADNVGVVGDLKLTGMWVVSWKFGRHLNPMRSSSRIVYTCRCKDGRKKWICCPKHMRVFQKRANVANYS